MARIIGLAPKVHLVLGLGFLESVYQDALARELVKAGLKVECGTMVSGSYDGVAVGGFVCDLLVEGLIPVENKPVHALVLAHGVQLANYLIANAIELGLLVNFGAERIEFKRQSRTYRPKPPLTLLVLRAFILSILCLLSQPGAESLPSGSPGGGHHGPGLQWRTRRQDCQDEQDGVPRLPAIRDFVGVAYVGDGILCGICARNRLLLKNPCKFGCPTRI